MNAVDKGFLGVIAGVMVLTAALGLFWAHGPACYAPTIAPAEAQRAQPEAVPTTTYSSIHTNMAIIVREAETVEPWLIRKAIGDSWWIVDTKHDCEYVRICNTLLVWRGTNLLSHR